MGITKSPRQTHSPGRTGRPTLDQAGVIDSAILQAATRLFLDKGYDGTSMEAAALAAGISKRTLYLRYGSKEALLKGVVEARVASWSAAASARNVNWPRDFKARMIQHAQTLAHSLGMKEIRDFDRLAQSTALRFPELAKAFYEIGYRYILEFLAEEIRNGTVSDAAPARNPERIAQQLLSMIVGWHRTEDLIRELGDTEVAEFAENAVETLFSGREAW